MYNFAKTVNSNSRTNLFVRAPIFPKAQSFHCAERLCSNAVALSAISFLNFCPREVSSERSRSTVEGQKFKKGYRLNRSRIAAVEPITKSEKRI
jgi:hypothetical protein